MWLSLNTTTFPQISVKLSVCLLNLFTNFSFVANLRMNRKKCTFFEYYQQHWATKYSDALETYWIPQVNHYSWVEIPVCPKYIILCVVLLPRGCDPFGTPLTAPVHTPYSSSTSATSKHRTARQVSPTWIGKNASDHTPSFVGTNLPFTQSDYACSAHAELSSRGAGWW